MRYLRKSFRIWLVLSFPGGDDEMSISLEAFEWFSWVVLDCFGVEWGYGA